MFYSHLMNQKFDLKRTAGTDEYDMPKIEEDLKEIPCRITYKTN